MAGSCQVGYESLAWSVKPSQNGNYVLVTFHVAHGREVACGESRTYRIPVESAEEFIRDFADAYGQCRAKQLPEYEDEP